MLKTNTSSQVPRLIMTEKNQQFERMLPNILRMLVDSILLKKKFF